MSAKRPYRPRFGVDIRVKPEGGRVSLEAETLCEAPGCREPATCRAPKSPGALREFRWFCQAHAQDYNRAWNFFRDMTPEQAERFRVEAAFANRPTWSMRERRMGAALSGLALDDGLGIFTQTEARPGGRAEAQARLREARMTGTQREALNVLALDARASLQDIRTRYKELLRRYHPDANAGARDGEDRLRRVIWAYAHLRATGWLRETAET